MEKLLEDVKVRAIGVSNFQIHHLNDLMETVNVMPMMNQVEVHPHLTQVRLQEFCTENGIPLTSYGSFGRGNIDNEEVLLKIAKKHDATIQQVVLRWLFQRGIFTIPKSVTPERIRSNLESTNLKLSLAEVESINGLNRARRYYGDPDNFNF